MDARVTEIMNNRSFIVPFNLLLKQAGIEMHSIEGENIDLTRQQLISLIQQLLAWIEVDEVWYRTTYKDIDEAIRLGKIGSAKEHFVSDGYFEGRLPGKVVVDEEFYVSQYPDVAESIDTGEISSAQEHFELHGLSEGRLPFKI